MDCGVTHEELAAFAAGDPEPGRAAQLEAHTATCARCRGRLDALRRVDALLGRLPRFQPPPKALLKARRALSPELRRTGLPEILTLEEAAAFLRISLDDLEEIVLELPAFELAGQLRIRRTRLIEWVEARERSYRRSSAQSEAARAFADTL